MDVAVKHPVGAGRRRLFVKENRLRLKTKLLK